MDVADHPYCLPNGRCGYFWFVVLGLLYVLGRVLRIVAMIALIGWVIYSFGYTFLEGSFQLRFYEDATLFQECIILTTAIVYAILVLFAFISIVGAFLSLIVFIGFMVKESVISYKTRDKNVDKQPNILVEYLRAKKNKFCPNVTYVDGDNDGN
jgi:hypothetical protein